MNTLATRTWRAAGALILALSFLAAPAYAQDTQLENVEPMVSQPPLSFGVRAGLVQTDFYGDAVGSANTRANLAGGAYLAYRFHPQLALQPEVMYMRRVGEVDHNEVFPSSRKAEYTLDFITAPLLLKAYVPHRNVPLPYLAVGPYAGLRVDADAHDANKVLDGVDIDDELRTWDYGLTAGLGLDSYDGRYAVSFDVRYNWGLANLFTGDDRPDFRTRGFMFTVGIGI